MKLKSFLLLSLLMLCACAGHDGGGWKPMAQAPKDGTILETKFVGGVAGISTWYGLYRWTDQYLAGGTGMEACDENNKCAPLPAQWYTATAKGWHSPVNNTGIEGEPELFKWRNFKGDPLKYNPSYQNEELKSDHNAIAPSQITNTVLKLSQDDIPLSAPTLQGKRP